VKTLLALTFLLLAACGSGSGGSDASPTKAIASEWVNSVDSDDVLDLTGVQFSTPYIATFIISVNAHCDCTAEVSGNESSGLFIIRACTYYGPGLNQCSMDYTDYTYTNSNANLTVCLNQDCTTYK